MIRKMRAEFKIFLAIFVATIVIINGQKTVDAAPQDTMPSDGTEGADKTEQGDLNQTSVASQDEFSGEEIPDDDDEIAGKTPQQLLFEFIQRLAETIPGIGHGIGVGYIAAGDEERGKEILKGASISTAGVIGGILGGPGGAVMARDLSDGVITGIQPVTRRPRVFGEIK